MGAPHRRTPFGVVSLDERLATRIAAALHPALRSAEIDRALGKPDSDLDAQDLALRAMPSVLSLDAEGSERALRLLNSAMELDPDHALSAALTAWVHTQRAAYEFTAEPVVERARAAALARRALSLRCDPTALVAVGSALSLLHDVEGAEQVIGRALATGAGLRGPGAGAAGSTSTRATDESAIEKLTIALELAPDNSHAFNTMVEIGMAYFNAGLYRDRRSGRRGRCSSTPRRRGSTRRSARHLLSAVRSPRPGTACIFCAGNTLI